MTEDDAANPAGGVDLVLRPGQEVLVRLGDVLSPFTNAAGIRVPDFTHPRPKLQVDADVLAGYPVVAATRVPFDLVAGLVAGGVPAERVGDYYPGVGAAAAQQATDYAAYVDQVAHRQLA